MKKKFKLIRKNKKFIFSLAIILILIGLFLHINNTLYAATNPEYYSEPSGFEEWCGNVMGSIMSTGAGVLGKPFALIVNLVNVILFMTMYMIFVESGVANGLTFPFPDQIIFNGVSLLDPNFINPVSDKKSLVGIMSSVIQNFYYSFFTLACTVFVLAAVIIGIKIALSSIASEKAIYKDAIKHWIMGLALLFLMHFILAGMFAINEQICISASKICQNVKFSISALEFVPVGGSTLKSLFETIGSIFGDADAFNFLEISVQGYGGLILKFLVNGVLQLDLIYAIGLSIMLGQTFSLIIMYLKRVFYCIVLGMLAPVIVAMDTIQKVVTGRDTGIFKNWFQNMFALIFNQSFQAIFLCVVIILMGKVDNLKGGNMDLIEALIAVISLNAIMKFDKLFKELLGFKDSRIMGGLNENVMRSFAAIKSGMSLAQRSIEPFKKRGEAQRRYNSAARKKAKILNNLSELGNGNSNGNSDGVNVNNTNNNNNNNTTSTNTNSSRNLDSSDRNSETAIISAMERLSRALENNTATKGRDDNDKIAEKRKKLNEELESVEAEMAKAKADKRAESLRAFTRFGTTIGSLGFGIGATDNFGDAVSVGNLVDMPMDRLTDREVDRGVYGNASRKFSQRESALVNKYVSKGMSESDARKLASSVVSNTTDLLNDKIPDSIGNMISDFSKDAFKGAEDVIDKSARKYTKNVRKKLYSSNNIDDIY